MWFLGKVLQLLPKQKIIFVQMGRLYKNWETDKATFEELNTEFSDSIDSHNKFEASLTAQHLNEIVQHCILDFDSNCHSEYTEEIARKKVPSWKCVRQC